MYKFFKQQTRWRTNKKPTVLFANKEEKLVVSPNKFQAMLEKMNSDLDKAYDEKEKRQAQLDREEIRHIEIAALFDGLFITFLAFSTLGLFMYLFWPR